MHRRASTLQSRALWAGLAAPALFLVALLALAAATPGYDHRLHGVGLLGSADAARPLSWNLFGFLLPGLLVAVFAWGLAKALARDGVGAAGRVGLWALALSGLALAACGLLPYDPGRPEAVGSQLHANAFALAMVAFAPGALLVSASTRFRAGWRSLTALGPALVAAFFVTLVWPLGLLLPELLDRPGLEQRITFALYFGWLLLAAGVALRRAR